MEYTQTYNVNRKMHSRPLGRVVLTIGDLRERNKGLDFTLENLKTGTKLSGRSLIALSTGGHFGIGDQVKVTVSGNNYATDTLKEYADRIGSIFALKDKDTSKTIWEIAHKQEYGRYPGEGSS